MSVRVFDRLGLRAPTGAALAECFAVMQRGLTAAMDAELGAMLYGVRARPRGSRRLFDWLDGARRPRVRFDRQGRYIELAHHFAPPVNIST